MRLDDLIELRRRLEPLGYSLVADDIIELGPIRIDAGARTVQRGGESVHLTPKEFDLLLALARARGHVVSRARLLREVWGYVDSVISRTVDTHIGELRLKLERDPSRPVHIVTVRAAGYKAVGGGCR